MTEISRAALFGRLGPTALKGIETATGFCRMRGNPYVELAHWFHTLNSDGKGDLGAICTKFGIDQAVLARDIVQSLDRLPRGASAMDFSAQVEDAVEKGWLYASLQFGAGKVRSGHLLYGILKTPNLRNAVLGVSGQFKAINADQLGEQFAAITVASSEANEGGGLATSGGGGAGGEAGEQPEAGAEGTALAKFTVDLTARARSGEIDKIIGRDAEIRQVIDILLRRRQNNPILTGEAGVGKVRSPRASRGGSSMATCRRC